MISTSSGGPSPRRLGDRRRPAPLLSQLRPAVGRPLVASPARCTKLSWVVHILPTHEVYAYHIGKYLSSLRTLNHVTLLHEGFEAQLCASRLSIPCRMSAAGMTRQIRNGRLERGIEPGHVPTLQGLDNGA